ncbi:hypothetical protein F4821DRAFT_97146 [Hypoxylon rubiginosum]|uniref:Uncharacterized protein n=1 Tax=Hypoxylon rubiginosum TaxID=110542 RepID=A0ACC0D584_9PEZI|nr:hypothetical protein F4821DRAFT_97146 [Hypoxylon rubiginosum]
MSFLSRGRDPHVEDRDDTPCRVSGGCEPSEIIPYLFLECSRPGCKPNKGRICMILAKSAQKLHLMCPTMLDITMRLLDGDPGALLVSLAHLRSLRRVYPQIGEQPRIETVERVQPLAVRTTLYSDLCDDRGTLLISLTSLCICFLHIALHIALHIVLHMVQKQIA